MIETLACAHSEGVIHRDLKPANMLMGSFGEMVVIDWGLAKDLGQPQPMALQPPEHKLPASADTRAGTVSGTPAYMAPEQALGQDVNARADVYALGAIPYHLLGGKAPYAGSGAVVHCKNDPGERLKKSRR